MPEKEVIKIDTAAANPNLSPATTFANLVFVAGQTGVTRRPVSSARTFESRPATRWSASA